MNLNSSKQRHESGSAAIVVVALLAIVLLYVGSTLQTLNHLDRDIKLVEKRQLRRLEHLNATNSVAIASALNAPIEAAKALSAAR